MNIKKKLRLSESMKNVTKISSGTMAGQLISMVTLPIFTRIYGASILGTWTIINSIATIVTAFSDLGLKNAIMIEKEDKGTEKLYTIITTITAFFAILSGLFAYVYYGFINQSLDMHPVITGLFVALIVFLTPQTQTCYTWLNKSGKYNVLMKNPLIQNIATGIVGIALGLLGFKRYGYYIGVIVGSVITLTRMKIHLPKKLFNFHIEDYKEMLRTKKEFYFYQMPTNLLGQFKEQVPVFAFQTFFGTEMVGYYSITMKYLKLPINLLAQAIGRVFLKNIADLDRKGQRIGEYALRNVTRAMRIAIIPMICIYAAGDVACTIMFGQDYSIAGNIMRIVASNTFFMFMLVSCQGMTVVLHKQKNNMIASIAQMVGYFGGIALGYYLTNNIYVSAAAMTIVYAVVQVTFFSSLFEAAGVKWYRYVLNVLKTLAIIAAGSVVIRFVLLLLGIVTHM